MTTRRRQPPPTPPSLSPEKAHLVLSKQLELLRDLKALGHREGIPKEQEWANFTGNIVLKAFGSESPNINQFVGAGSAGEYFVIPFGASEDPSHTERNYQARLQLIFLDHPAAVRVPAVLVNVLAEFADDLQ